MELPYTLDSFLLEPTILQLPIYQRQFSWGKKELEDLWNDLIYFDRENKKRYYFGAILLQKTSPQISVGLRTYDVLQIIDGQQRIAASLILLRSIIDMIKSLKDPSVNIKEIESLEENYLKRGSITRLTLSGEDQAIFQSILSEEKLPEPKTQSQKRLKDAKDFFMEKFRIRKDIDKEGFKEFLLDIKEKILSFEILKHVVEDETEAALMFQTVNDRGMPLSTLDKTKSLLMYMVYLSARDDASNHLKQINSNFAKIFSDSGRMIDLLRGENIGEDGALRTHWAFFDGILPASSDIATYYLKPKLMELYKAFKKDECLTYATQYASSLESAFLAIKETLTYDKTNELRNSLDRVFGLNRAFPIPLITCAWIKTQKDPTKLMQLLNSVERFIIRYQGFQRKRSRIEERFYAWSNSLYQGKVDFTATVSSIDQLCRNNAPDTSFRSALESPAFYNVSSTFAVKLLFFELERELRRQQKQDFEIPVKEWLSEKFQIEHIWAQSYMIYGGYLNQEYDSYQNHGQKLGNLTVLPRTLNAALANMGFEYKKQQYSKVDLNIVKELTIHQSFREKEILERTARLREFAMKRWAIPG